jgi:hypothetical protein
MDLPVTSRNKFAAIGSPKWDVEEQQQMCGLKKSKSMTLTRGKREAEAALCATNHIPARKTPGKAALLSSSFIHVSSYFPENVARLQ